MSQTSKWNFSCFSTIKLLAEVGVVCYNKVKVHHNTGYCVYFEQGQMLRATLKPLETI